MLLSSGSTFKTDRSVCHAEGNVAREASQQYDPQFLAQCTLCTSAEPCCICAGACYWAGIGTVVYGMTEKRLAVPTGDNPENLRLDMPCEQVFATGQRKVETRGPFAELEARSRRGTGVSGETLITYWREGKNQMTSTTIKESCGVDEVPPIGRMIVLALQHVIVMYSGAIAVPFIIGGALHLNLDQLPI